MASITKYKDKRTGTDKYKFRLYLGRDVHGKQIIKTKQGFSTKQAAELAMSKFQVELNQKGIAQFQTQMENKDLIFADVWEMWHESYKTTVRLHTDAMSINYNKNHIAPYFGGKHLRDITTQFCQYMMDQWYKAGYKNCNLFMQLVSQVFEYAIKMGLTDVNPTKSVIRPRVDRARNTDNYYTKDELKHFLECCQTSGNNILLPFFRLLAFSGMRKGEALALFWTDLDFEHNIIHINKSAGYVPGNTYLDKPKTKSSIRDVYVDQKTMDILADWKTKQKQWMYDKMYTIKRGKRGNYLRKEPTLVFASSRNDITNTTVPRNWLVKLYKQFPDLKHITTHGFRHTYATLAFEGGMNIKQVQAQLGHKNVQMTLDIYTAVTDKQRKGTADIYSKYVDF